MVSAVKHRITGLIRWLETILGPRPGLKELNVVCWGLFVAGFVIPVTAYLWIRYKSGARFSDPMQEVISPNCNATQW